jgi:flagellar hook-basal body complex protein FliE
MKADKAEMSDAEKSSNLKAFFEACKIAAEKVAQKQKKTKVVTRRLTQKQIDAVLSANVWTRPVPICSEELLAGLDEADLWDS